MSYLRVDLQLRRGRLFWAAHLQPSRTIPLRRLLSDYWDSTGYEFVLPGQSRSPTRLLISDRGAQNAGGSERILGI